MKYLYGICALLVIILGCTPAMPQANDQPFVAFATYIDADSFNHPQATFKPMLLLWVRIPILPIGAPQMGRIDVLTANDTTSQIDRFKLADCNRVCSCCFQDAEWWGFTIGPVTGFDPTRVTVTYYRGAESTDAIIVGLPQ